MPANEDAIFLTSEPIETAALVQQVHVPVAGGVCVFLGTTRAEISPDGHELLALDYEAYPEMATEQLRDLGTRARQQWPAVRLAIVHRTGRVALAEPSVLIAVSTPHRADAFECCRWLIDTLKAELAVWKREVWEGGRSTWARPNREWRGTTDA